MYKLIAIDLDGTLLNSYGDVSDENKKAIENARKRDIEVVLTSGRMSDSVIAIADEVGANNFMIAGNGALIYDLKNKKTLYNQCIPKEKVLKIIKICEENSIYYTINTEKYILAKSLNYNLMYYYYENSKKKEDKKTRINIVEDVEKYICENDVGEITKITISDETEMIFKGITKKLKEIKGINILEVSNMSRKIINSGTEKNELRYFYTEITKENVDKFEALKKLAEYIGISTSEIVAIGDNINDKMMIENAGIGIAMGKSDPKIKEIADKVVATNNECGVAEAMSQK